MMNKKDDILNVDNFWASTFETLVPLRFSTLKLTCSLKQNFCRLFHVLAQLLLTTNEMEVYYDHKKVNLRVSSHAAEFPHNLRLKNLEISRESLKYFD